MLSADEHDELVALFYRAAAGDIPWTQPLERCASLFCSSASMLAVYDGRMSGLLAIESHSYDQAFLYEYLPGELCANDPRMPAVYDLPPGSFFHDEMLYDVEEMWRDPRVKACNDALQATSLMGMKLRLPSDCTMQFGLLRQPREGRPGDEETGAMARLAPCIEQACALGYVVEREAATRLSLLEAMAQKADGVILLEPAGRVLFMNDVAVALLQAGDGLGLDDGGFITRRPPETRRLQAMVAATLRGYADPGRRVGGQMLVSRPSGKRPYVLRVAPPPPADGFLATGRLIGCVIHIQDLADVHSPAPETLCAVFGLTPREAQLAVELVRCASLEPAAARAGMALNTARNHLHSIFRKTGAANQAEAVQLMGRI